MRINVAIPEEHVSKPVLDGALEAVTRLNESMIKSGAAPTDLQLLEQGAIWKPEPPGDEHFDHGAKIAQRGWGDCDDWAPLRAARLRVTGEDRGARAVVRKSGPKRWHATVIRSDGSEDDPSVDAGMLDRSRTIGARGSWLPIMFPSVHGVGGTYNAQPNLALRPIVDRHGQLESWQARADLPWHAPLGDQGDVAMVTLHRSPVSSQAIVGAVRGAWALGYAANNAHPEHLRRMSAIAEACEGAPWEDIAERYGEDHANAAGQIVGSFFGKALRKIGKVAKGAVKLAAPALNLIPGGSIATAAFNAASPHVKKSVLHQQHVAPAARQPVRVAPSSARAATAEHYERAAGGNTLILNLGWPGAAASTAGPGEAWPPRA